MAAVPDRDVEIVLYDLEAIPVDESGVESLRTYMADPSRRWYAERLVPAFHEAGLLAAGEYVVPVVNAAADVPAAIEAALANPDYRWYVTKRVRALGLLDPLPWEAEAESEEPETGTEEAE